jgi:hypothetical protein
MNTFNQKDVIQNSKQSEKLPKSITEEFYLQSSYFELPTSLL